MIRDFRHRVYIKITQFLYDDMCRVNTVSCSMVVLYVLVKAFPRVLHENIRVSKRQNNIVIIAQGKAECCISSQDHSLSAIFFT